MTRDEWGLMSDVVAHAWPGEFPPAAVEAYFFVLESVPIAAVSTALDQILSSGARFRPSASEILAAARGGRVAIASPEEAWALIVRAIDRCPSIYHQDRVRLHQEAINWLAEQDRVVAAYAARRGLIGPGSLGAEDVLDPKWGAAAVKRIHGEFRDWVKQVDSRVERGLPPVEDRMLLIRADPPPGGMGALLDHLRPPEQIGEGDRDV